MVETSGRDCDVADNMEVNVSVNYCDTEDARPRMLLQLYAEQGRVDVDASPTAAQARRIAMNLLEAAEALEDWAGRNR